MSGHQDRRIQDAVLLGADEFLAVDDEHRLGAVIEDQELGDRAALGDLSDGDGFGRHGLLQADVGRSAIDGAGEREHDDVAVGLRPSEVKVLQVVLDVGMHRYRMCCS
jgi:hypothetical protein